MVQSKDKASTSTYSSTSLTVRRQFMTSDRRNARKVAFGGVLTVTRYLQRPLMRSIGALTPAFCPQHKSSYPAKTTMWLVSPLTSSAHSTASTTGTATV